MKQIEIIVPACFKMWYAKRLKRKGKYTKVVDWHAVYLNLNYYRNWNHHFSNDVKKKFSEIIFEQMQLVPKMEKIVQIEYTLLVATDRRRDRMNAYSIIDKFFCDALQSYEKITDDSDEFIEKFIFNQTEKIQGKQEDIACKIKIHYISK